MSLLGGSAERVAILGCCTKRRHVSSRASATRGHAFSRVHPTASCNEVAMKSQISCGSVCCGLISTRLMDHGVRFRAL